MQELPTNKPNFLFNNTQDFNQTKHAAPHLPIVFIDDIRFYFYAIISVKVLMEESCHSDVTAISTQSEIFLSFEVEYALQNTKCMLFSTVLYKLDWATISTWWKVEIYMMC